jgi:hypothetical protein
MRQLDDPRVAACKTSQLSQRRWDDHGAAASSTQAIATEYFDHCTLSGSSVVSRNVRTIDFDWGSDSPDPAVPDNVFSARWTRTMSYVPGTYRFTVTGDDGIRVLVNGWFYQAPTTCSADVAMPEGQHIVFVNFFKHIGAPVTSFSQTKTADG